MNRWIMVLSAFVCIGCALPQVRPSPDTRKAFDLIDSIEVCGIRISDAETIARLKAIHTRSKWDPMPTTLPIDMITIYGLENGERRFKLLYSADWIMDTDGDGRIVRLGRLNEEDRNWMDVNIRSLVPPNPNIL